MEYEPCLIAVGVMKVRLITTLEACCLATRAIEERYIGQLCGFGSWGNFIPRLGATV
jgi:hypothetical protein